MTENQADGSGRPAGFTVIAHRGASGYLPEHTLEGVAMAHAMGVDYIEQDVVLTRDNEVIVLHDLYLDAVTDVAKRYPGRQRHDGHFYAIDFDLEEIRTLRLHERLAANGKPVFPGRFPPDKGVFRVPTLREEIELVQGLNQSTGVDVGIYVEPKAPAWHRDQGRNLVFEVVRILAEAGYDSRDDRAILQSFDMDSLIYARKELECDLKLVQLIGENRWRESPSDFDYLQTGQGLAAIADYADGIGPWLPLAVHISGANAGTPSGLVAAAHRHGLLVHAYTLRADQLPSAIPNMDSALKVLKGRVGLDGVFTDHPDQVIHAIQLRQATWRRR